MFINHTSKEVTAKIVYYGPGLSGKTTNLQYIFSVTNPKARGELVSIQTDIERTLFFDLLPLNVGLIQGYQTKFQLYTVPGQIFYDSTRKLVLKGADGVVFVCDSQEPMEEANIESYYNLKENLQENGQSIDTIPLVFQYNKRDLKNVIKVARFNQILNQQNRAFFEATARQGSGVIETLREISGQTLEKIRKAIDHATTPEQPVPSPKTEVNFDTDLSREIISKDELPLKQINLKEEETDLLPESEESDAGVPATTASASDNKPTLREMKRQFLDGQEDKSRITVLKKLPVNGSGVSIEVKDGNANLLDTIDLQINPDTKKITLIFDINSGNQ